MGIRYKFSLENLAEMWDEKALVRVYTPEIDCEEGDELVMWQPRATVEVNIKSKYNKKGDKIKDTRTYWIKGFGN
jgi:hypothetical protein